MEKLIRDGYIEIIDEKEFRFANESEILSFSVKKLDEEINELKDSDFNDVMEYADVLEIIEKIASLKGITHKDILKAKYKKNKEKGSFYKNIIWSYNET